MSCGYCHAHCAHFLSFLEREREGLKERKKIFQAFFARIVAMGLLGVYVPRDSGALSAKSSV